MTVPPDDPPPPTSPPIGAGRSIALGCSGFVGFFVAAAIVATGFGGGPLLGTALLLAAVAAVVGLVRRADAPRRAALARVAVGFAIAAVVFGGCIALIANTSFH